MATPNRNAKPANKTSPAKKDDKTPTASRPAPAGRADSKTRPDPKAKQAKRSSDEKTLDDLYLDELKDVYDAENQLIEALPKIAEAVSTASLQQAILDHLEETRGHVERLEQAFAEIGETAKRKTCEAMKGLLKEGKKAIEELPEGSVRDAAIIAGSQRIEHYEISAYGTLRAFAETLGNEEAVGLLESTLKEEKAADEKLSEIATSEVNEAAASGSDDEDDDEGEGETE